MSLCSDEAMEVFIEYTLYHPYMTWKADVLFLGHVKRYNGEPGLHIKFLHDVYYEQRPKLRAYKSGDEHVLGVGFLAEEIKRND